MADLPHLPPVRARLILELEGQQPLVFGEDLLEMQVHAAADAPDDVRANLPDDATYIGLVSAASVRDLIATALAEVDAGIANDPHPKEYQ